MRYRDLALLAATCLLASCGQPKVSGLYMEHDASGVVTMQVVEDGDQRLTGRAEFMVVDAVGAVTDRSDAVTGAVDGSTIALTLKAEGLLEAARSLSGSVVAGVLRLDGSGPAGHIRLVLSRTSQDAVQAAMATLAEAAANRRQALSAADAEKKAHADRQAFIGRVVATTAAEDSFSGKQGHVLSALDHVQSVFRAATAAMRTKVAQEATVSGDGQAAVARSQLYLAANQIALQANQGHLELQQAERNFQQKVAELERPTIDLQQGCHRAHPATPDNPVATGFETWNADCLRLSSSAADFEAARTTISRAFAATEAVWTTEKAAQDALDERALFLSH